MAGSYSARSALMAPLHWPTLPLPGTMILSVMKIGHLCDSKTLLKRGISPPYVSPDPPARVCRTSGPAVILPAILQVCSLVELTNGRAHDVGTLSRHGF
jgi:hypothetical protein